MSCWVKGVIQLLLKYGIIYSKILLWLILAYVIMNNYI